MKDLSSSGSANLGAAVSMLILSTAAVVLRFAFRLQAKHSITLSDTFIALSLAFAFVSYGFNINYIVYGPGPGTYSQEEVFANIESGGIAWGNALLKALWFTEVFFTASLSLAKLSILHIYHLIFGISTPFRRFNFFMIGAVTFFWIFFTFMFIFQCHPVTMYWNLLQASTHCMGQGRLLFAFEFTNLFLDLVMLAMPPAMISQLQLSKGRKWSISGILLVGGMVCIICIVRLYYIYEPSSAEFMRNLPATMIAAHIQLGVAILCACFPTYTPLLRLFKRCLERSKPRPSSKVYRIQGYPLRPTGSKPILESKETIDRDLVDRRSSIDSNSSTYMYRQRDDLSTA